MKVNELDETEQMVLVALTAHVVAADGELTDDEADAMDYLQEEMGEDDWDLANNRARARRTTKESAVDLAQQVEGVAARSLIHAMLLMVAESDGIAPEEQELLDKLSEAWGL